MADGSVLVSGSGEPGSSAPLPFEPDVPRWLRDTGKGWVTAEYNRCCRVRVRSGSGAAPRGATRRYSDSSAAASGLSAISDSLGERSITVDCDVLQADGGTRTASICGGFVALHDALTRLVEAGQLASHPLTDHCAAISVGIVDGECRLDLPYVEDAAAEVDMNVVMSGVRRIHRGPGHGRGRGFSAATS